MAFFISESLRDLENSTFYTRWAKKGARCLDGVRGSRPLYTMIAWLLEKCTFQAKKCCFFKGRSPLFSSQNSQGIAIHFRLAKSWDVFDGLHKTYSDSEGANGPFVDPCQQLCTVPHSFSMINTYKCITDAYQ